MNNEREQQEAIKRIMGEVNRAGNQVSPGRLFASRLITFVVATVASVLLVMFGWNVGVDAVANVGDIEVVEAAGLLVAGLYLRMIVGGAAPK